ncbi:hypothetical protein PGTUg99_024448 [Puccinia graminis f. sp. tritici]|uniref:SH3 domain-containing protein n=1 Tax=Puccinia graminis f. sp. tritici TaxID=56615 RepID=A0A5B0MXC5_PUCGR|nr:hypothetical protein PGTUg99_024448 [Puccinia graminis f. sp. tritici]
MAHQSHARPTRKSTGYSTQSSLLLPDQSSEWQSTPRHSAITSETDSKDRLQLFQIQHKDLIHVRPTAQTHQRHSRLGRSPRAAVILPRQLTNSYPSTNYPAFQKPNQNDLGQSSSMSGQSPSYSGPPQVYSGPVPVNPDTAPGNAGTTPGNTGSASANTGSVPANTSPASANVGPSPANTGPAPTYPVQAPSAGGAVTPPPAGVINSSPGEDQPPPAHPAPSASAPPPSPEPHRPPPQAHQATAPGPAPAPPENGGSAGSSVASSAAPSTANSPAAAATPPQTADDYHPTSSPVPHHPFNLSNSSIVVAVPSHVPSANLPDSNPQTTNGTHSEIHHKADDSTSAAPIVLAVVLPIALVLLGAAIITYRLLRRGRRGHAHNRTSYDSQLIGSVDPQHQMENMSEKHRFSSYLKSSYTQMDDDLSNFALRREESRPGPTLPPFAAPSPPRPSTTSVRAHAHDSNTSDPGNTTGDSLKGGVACKMNCTVTRTFSPTMPDELKIGIGDRVTVFMLFDDGWCLGENLDFEKHPGAEGSSRTGVLPQDCLSGIKRTSATDTSEKSGLAPSWKTAGEEAPNTPARPTASQEILADRKSDSSQPPDSVHKPHRNSSLLGEREAQLFLELDHALSFS